MLCLFVVYWIPYYLKLSDVTVIAVRKRSSKPDMLKDYFRHKWALRASCCIPTWILFTQELELVRAVIRGLSHTSPQSVCLYCPQRDPETIMTGTDRMLHHRHQHAHFYFICIICFEHHHPSFIVPPMKTLEYFQWQSFLCEVKTIYFLLATK